MALKDTWKDKVDGIDDVLASDINSIAHSAIELEKKVKNIEDNYGGGSNIELAQSLSGNEEDKAPSVRAVNDGLEGKVDKKTGTGKFVYTAEDGVQTIRRISTSPVSWNIPWFDENGNLKSKTPVADIDCANKGYVDKGLAGKVDIVKKTSGIHVYTSETDGQRTRQAVNSPNPYMVALYDGKRVLKTETPNDDLDCTNKRYVDRKCRDLQQGVYNALGVQYITVEDTNDGFYPSVPENAMRFACIESVGNAVACAEDGTEIGSVDVRVTANYAPVDITTLPVFVDMGDSLLLHYEVDYAPDGTFYVKVTGRKIIYQVKVGG